MNRAGRARERGPKAKAELIKQVESIGQIVLPAAHHAGNGCS